MRILSLGFPMPGPRVDNHDFLSAPAFFDYDAIVVDPLALSQRIEDVTAGRAEEKTRSGVAIVNDAGGPDEVSLGDVLRARSLETERLLAHGGVVVCFLQPAAVHGGIDGQPAYERYGWLPAPESIRYAELLRAGTGSQVGQVETAQAFGPFVEQLRDKLAYQAYVADDTPGFDGAVFARSAGGAAIGVEVRVGGGTVVFLPSLAREPAVEQRYVVSATLQECIRQALGTAAAGSPPPWLSEYALSGLQEHQETPDEANEGSGQAQGTGGAAAADLERYQRLLWQEGRYGLAEPVRAALALLGFEVFPTDVDAPIWVRPATHGDEPVTALVEIEAAEEPVGLEGHYRLRRRLEEAIAQEKVRRGVLFINGYRRLAPRERPRQYQEALRLAAETMRYCVATTEQLFLAVRAALNGDESTIASFRERLLTTEGILRED